MKLGRKYTTNIKRIKRENNETEQLKTTQKKRVSNWALQNYMAPNQKNCRNSDGNTLHEDQEFKNTLRSNKRICRRHLQRSSKKKKFCSQPSSTTIHGTRQEELWTLGREQNSPSTGPYKTTWHQNQTVGLRRR